MPTNNIKNLEPTEHLTFADKAKESKSDASRVYVDIESGLVQLGGPDDLVYTKYGANLSYKENDMIKVDLTLYEEEDASKLEEVEDYAQAVFKENVRTWCKKDKATWEYVPLLKKDPDGNWLVSVKVVCDDAKKKTPTKIHVLTAEHKVDRTMEAHVGHVNRGAQLAVQFKFSCLWINKANAKYGLSMVADTIYVKPNPKADVALSEEQKVAGAGFDFA